MKTSTKTKIKTKIKNNLHNEKYILIGVLRNALHTIVLKNYTLSFLLITKLRSYRSIELRVRTRKTDEPVTTKTISLNMKKRTDELLDFIKDNIKEYK